MSEAKNYDELTPEQQRYVIERYPDDGDRTLYVYEISLRTGRFMCRHKKPKFTTPHKTK